MKRNTIGAEIALSVLCWLLATIIPVSASGQCQDPKSGPGVPACGNVPNTQYTLERVNWLINDAAAAVQSCNRGSGWTECENVDRLLYDADVAIDQMLRACTPQSSCRNGSLTALCTRTERLSRVARAFENNAGARRSYDNSLAKIQSWFDTPLCSHLHPSPTPAPIPAPNPSPGGHYSNSGGFACFGSATYPVSWRSEASCNSFGCYFGRMNSVQECLQLGAAKGATEVVFGTSGSRANECWLQSSCGDKRPHNNFSFFVGDGAPAPRPAPLPPPSPRPCDASRYNPYGCN